MVCTSLPFLSLMTTWRLSASRAQFDAHDALLFDRVTLLPSTSTPWPIRLVACIASELW
jgi:hypothetical protein